MSADDGPPPSPPFAPLPRFTSAMGTALRWSANAPTASFVSAASASTEAGEVRIAFCFAALLDLGGVAGGVAGGAGKQGGGG